MDESIQMTIAAYEEIAKLRAERDEALTLLRAAVPSLDEGDCYRPDDERLLRYERAALTIGQLRAAWRLLGADAEEYRPWTPGLESQQNSGENKK